MSFPGITANLERVRERVADVQKAAGLSQRVQIIAVTKGHPGAAVLAAIEAGVTDVGENRVQEALRKQDELGHLPVAWHLIGHLQTNKAKAAAGRFAAVHSVDSLRVAEALEAANLKLGTAGLDVLLQVNIGHEPQKAGVMPDEVGGLAELVSTLPGLRLGGLMAIPPATNTGGVARADFERMHRLVAELGLAELSMGMSADLELAVELGATMVRIGTAIFGPRPD